MQRFMIALAALLALSQGAQAVCSKNSLKGVWAGGFGGSGIIASNTNNSMPIFVPVGSFSTLKITSFGSNCKGLGVVNTYLGGSIFANLPAQLTSETVNGASSVKPNLLAVRVFLTIGAEYTVNLRRVQ